MVILNQNNDVEQLFPIVEIFHSVQGEGFQCRIRSEHQKSDQQMPAFVLLIAFLPESGQRHEQFLEIVVLPFQFR